MSEKFKNNLSSIVSSLLCIIGGLIIGFVVLLIIDSKNAASIFTGLIQGGFGSSLGWKTGLADQLIYVTPLICCGLSVLFAYKTGLFNIGVAGQYTLGAFAAILFAIKFNCPWYVCLIFSILFGAIWGAIPGILKAQFQVNEVITCIMTNWIGLFLVNDLFDTKISVDFNLGGVGISRIFNNAKTLSLASTNTKAIIPSFELFKGLSGGTLTISISLIIAIILAVCTLILLNHTTFGFELKACGSNKNAAKYAGIKEKRNIILSMAIAGAFAGLAAGLFYLCDVEQFPRGTTSLSGLAFNGIPVAFMASLNPIASIFSSFLIAHIDRGAANIAGSTFSKEMSSVFTGILIYFCAFIPFIVTYIKKHFFKKDKGGKK